jgi:hypothetical protein
MSALIRCTSTIIIACIIIGFGIWWFRYDAQMKQIEALNQTNQALNRELDLRLEMIERLSRHERCGVVQILSQAYDESDQIDSTTFRFIELDEDGSELARQEFTVPSDVIYIDTWTVKFAEEAVATGHPLQGRTLILLRRVFSDEMAPIEGFSIDTPGGIPPAYSVSELGTYQQDIWSHFWELATDARIAAAMGVRVAQGEAAYKRVRAGQEYQLSVDADGGINLVPVLAEPALTHADE